MLLGERGETDPYSGRCLIRWTPHPVIVTIRDNWDDIRVLVYSRYTTTTGWGVHLTSEPQYRRRFRFVCHSCITS